MKPTPDTFTSETFGEAIAGAEAGNPISRKGWDDDEFVFRQVPSIVPAEIIPKMSSLPAQVKAHFVNRGTAIHYRHQWAKVKGGVITGWSPSPEDTFAGDWQIHYATGDGFTAAPVAETAGTATPLE